MTKKRDTEIEQLARDLFIRNWMMGTSYTAAHFLDQCLVAAEAFYEAVDQKNQSKVQQAK